MSDIAFDLDALLDGVVLEAALANGRNPSLAASQYGASRVIAAARSTGGVIATLANRWSPDEAAFLNRYAGVLGDEEIADRLGRTVDAIRVQRIRRGLPGPASHPEYITGNRMARALGIDGHMVIDLIERGILAAELAPMRDRTTWRMRRSAFIAWAVNPANWPYFYRSVRSPERMGDARLRRLIQRRAAVWGDEWLTPGEVAALHGVHHTDVNRYINAGRLTGVKWNNWLIRRSAATAPDVRFFKGKGAGVLERAGTARGDAFLVLAAAVGVPYNQITRMARRGDHASYVQSRLGGLHRAGYTPWLIRSFGLPVLHRPADTPVEDGARWQAHHAITLWADWRPVAHRFPRLARVWWGWVVVEPWGMDMADHYLVNGVLKAAVRWNVADAAEVGRLVHGLSYRVAAVEQEVRPLWYEWTRREWTAAAEFPSPEEGGADD